jgi:3-hydroxybutyrate dehydrogenase
MSDQAGQGAALVTGSSSGIGLGIAEALAAAGHDVMLNGLDPETEVAPERDRLAETHGVRTAYVRADLTDGQAVDDLVGEAEDRLGPLAVQVNNAGVQHVAPIAEFPDDKWELILALNLSAAFRAIRAVVPGMTARGHGRIINIASAHGLVASPGKAAYVSAKHGLLGLTKTAALETAEHGVTVNAICPGYVWTPLVEGQIPETAQARGMTEEEVKRDVLLAAQPTRDFVTTAQVGALAAFLCSDAAAQITGAALPVDGGWTAQ